jgi:hypothetical protein
MTSRVISRNLRRSASIASVAAVLLVVAGAQASADPVQTRFKIAWSACEKSPQTQCGTLKVPLDWSRPSGATISLVVARRPAKDPGRRVGTLFFNPGARGRRRKIRRRCRDVLLAEPHRAIRPGGYGSA